MKHSYTVKFTEDQMEDIRYFFNKSFHEKARIRMQSIAEYILEECDLIKKSSCSSDEDNV